MVNKQKTFTTFLLLSTRDTNSTVIWFLNYMSCICNLLKRLKVYYHQVFRSRSRNFWLSKVVFIILFYLLKSIYKLGIHAIFGLGGCLNLKPRFWAFRSEILFLHFLLLQNAMQTKWRFQLNKKEPVKAGRKLEIYINISLFWY